MCHPRLSATATTARAVVAAICLVSLSGSATALPNDFVVEPILTGVPLPVNMAFASDGRIFFNELHTGRIRIIKGGQLLPQPFYSLPVWVNNERGLIGIALAPDFPTDPWVYIYRTARLGPTQDAAENRLERIRAEGDVGVQIETLLVLPTSSGIHNGGEILFGPDRKLYVFVGEANQAGEAQMLDVFNGKILRLEPDANAPGVADNPFAGADPVRSRIWSRGHRNSIGLTFNPVTGGLYQTENGPNRCDEINHIFRGANYGWDGMTYPACKSPKQGVTNPLYSYDPTIAVTGLAFMSARAFPPNYAGDIIFGDYNFGRLRRIDFDPNQVDKILAVNDTFFELEDLIPPNYADDAALGALDVQTGPDGFIWFTVGDFAFRPPGSPVSPLGGIYRLRHRTFHPPDAASQPGTAGFAILGAVAVCLIARRRPSGPRTRLEASVATRVGS